MSSIGNDILGSYYIAPTTPGKGIYSIIYLSNTVPIVVDTGNPVNNKTDTPVLLPSPGDTNVENFGPVGI